MWSAEVPERSNTAPRAQMEREVHYVPRRESMSRSGPQPLQPLRTPAPQLLQLGVTLDDLLQRRQALQAATCAGQEEKLVDGLNRPRANNSILRAKRRTQDQ